MTMQMGVVCVCVCVCSSLPFLSFFYRFASILTSAELKELGQKWQAVSLQTDKDESTAVKGNAGTGNKNCISNLISLLSVGMYCQA